MSHSYQKRGIAAVVGVRGQVASASLPAAEPWACDLNPVQLTLEHGCLSLRGCKQKSTILVTGSSRPQEGACKCSILWRVIILTKRCTVMLVPRSGTASEPVASQPSRYLSVVGDARVQLPAAATDLAVAAVANSVWQQNLPTMLAFSTLDDTMDWYLSIRRYQRALHVQPTVDALLIPKVPFTTFPQRHMEGLKPTVATAAHRVRLGPLDGPSFGSIWHESLGIPSPKSLTENASLSGVSVGAEEAFVYLPPAAVTGMGTRVPLQSIHSITAHAAYNVGRYVLVVRPMRPSECEECSQECESEECTYDWKFTLLDFSRTPIAEWLSSVLVDVRAGANSPRVSRRLRGRHWLGECDDLPRAPPGGAMRAREQLWWPVHLPTSAVEASMGVVSALSLSANDSLNSPLSVHAVPQPRRHSASHDELKSCAAAHGKSERLQGSAAPPENSSSGHSSNILGRSTDDDDGGDDSSNEVSVASSFSFTAATDRLNSLLAGERTREVEDLLSPFAANGSDVGATAHQREFPTAELSTTTAARERLENHAGGASSPCGEWAVFHPDASRPFLLAVQSPPEVGAKLLSEELEPGAEVETVEKQQTWYISLRMTFAAEISSQGYCDGQQIETPVGVPSLFLSRERDDAAAFIMSEREDEACTNSIRLDSMPNWGIAEVEGLRPVSVGGTVGVVPDIAVHGLLSIVDSDENVAPPLLVHIPAPLGDSGEKFDVDRSRPAPVASAIIDALRAEVESAPSAAPSSGPAGLVSAKDTGMDRISKAWYIATRQGTCRSCSLGDHKSRLSPPQPMHFLLCGPIKSGFSVDSETNAPKPPQDISLERVTYDWAASQLRLCPRERAGTPLPGEATLCPVYVEFIDNDARQLLARSKQQPLWAAVKAALQSSTCFVKTPTSICSTGFGDEEAVAVLHRMQEPPKVLDARESNDDVLSTTVYPEITVDSGINSSTTVGVAALSGCDHHVLRAALPPSLAGLRLPSARRFPQHHPLRIVFIGGIGAGKSTLLRWIWSRCRGFDEKTISALEEVDWSTERESHLRAPSPSETAASPGVPNEWITGTQPPLRPDTQHGGRLRKDMGDWLRADDADFLFRSLGGVGVSELTLAVCAEGVPVEVRIIDVPGNSDNALIRTHCSSADLVVCIANAADLYSLAWVEQRLALLRPADGDHSASGDRRLAISPPQFILCCTNSSSLRKVITSREVDAFLRNAEGRSGTVRGQHLNCDVPNAAHLGGEPHLSAVSATGEASQARPALGGSTSLFAQPLPGVSTATYGNATTWHTWELPSTDDVSPAACSAAAFDVFSTVVAELHFARVVRHVGWTARESEVYLTNLVGNMCLRSRENGLGAATSVIAATLTATVGIPRETAEEVAVEVMGCPLPGMPSLDDAANVATYLTRELCRWTAAMPHSPSCSALSSPICCPAKPFWKRPGQPPTASPDEGPSHSPTVATVGILDGLRLSHSDLGTEDPPALSVRWRLLRWLMTGWCTGEASAVLVRDYLALVARAPPSRQQSSGVDLLPFSPQRHPVVVEAGSAVGVRQILCHKVSSAGGAVAPGDTRALSVAELLADLDAMVAETERQLGGSHTPSRPLEDYLVAVWRRVFHSSGITLGDTLLLSLLAAPGGPAAGDSANAAELTAPRGARSGVIPRLRDWLDSGREERQHRLCSWLSQLLDALSPPPRLHAPLDRSGGAPGAAGEADRGQLPPHTRLLVQMWLVRTSRNPEGLIALRDKYQNLLERLEDPVASPPASTSTEAEIFAASLLGSELIRWLFQTKGCCASKGPAAKCGGSCGHPPVQDSATAIAPRKAHPGAVPVTWRTSAVVVADPLAATPPAGFGSAYRFLETPSPSSDRSASTSSSFSIRTAACSKDESGAQRCDRAALGHLHADWRWYWTIEKEQSHLRAAHNYIVQYEREESEIASKPYGLEALQRNAPPRWSYRVLVAEGINKDAELEAQLSESVLSEFGPDSGDEW